MPFVSKFNGHGRIPGIHKPPIPPIPVFSNTATTFDSLTFNLSNYDARWQYTGSTSPAGGTVSFSGATVNVTGLTGSTAYTVTVTAIGSGGLASGTANATTSAPPPFFPPFFPFFPFFPPFFPFFPPFFPFFPPFFPFFPPFFPSFRPPPPPSKTAPSNQLRDDSKVMILTSDYGYLEAKYLTEDDSLISLNIDGLGTNNVIIENQVDTKITSITSSSSIHAFIYINGEAYPENLNILVENEGIVSFKKPTEIDTAHKLFNYEKSEFVEINNIELEEVYSIMYNIVSSPNNFYVVQSTIGYFE